MCISLFCFVLCFHFYFILFFTNTGKSKLTFCCSPILKESSVSILACIIKCRYLSGSKKKHTKAPVSLRFTTLEEGGKKEERNNFMKDVQSNLNLGPLQSPRYSTEFPLVVRSRTSGVAMTAPVAATLSAHRPADALEVSMATRNGVTWLWRTIRANQSDNAEGQKTRIKSWLMLLVTFIPALPKNVYMCVCESVCCLLFCFFTFVCFRHLPFCSCLCKPVLAVCVSDVKGEEHECNPPAPFFLLTFNNIVPVTLQSKSFKWKLMWNSVWKYYFYGSLI